MNKRKKRVESSVYHDSSSQLEHEFVSRHRISLALKSSLWKSDMVDQSGEI